MASTYTPLGVELQATGENAGTWGTKTNTNLQIIEQIAGGYTTQAVSDSGDSNIYLFQMDQLVLYSLTQNYRVYRIFISISCYNSFRCTKLLSFKKCKLWCSKRNI